MRQRFSILVDVDISEADPCIAVDARNLQAMFDRALPLAPMGTIRTILVSRVTGEPTSEQTDG